MQASSHGGGPPVIQQALNRAGMQTKTLQNNSKITGNPSEQPVSLANLLGQSLHARSEDFPTQLAQQGIVSLKVAAQVAGSIVGQTKGPISPGQPVRTLRHVVKQPSDITPEKKPSFFVMSKRETSPRRSPRQNEERRARDGEEIQNFQSYMVAMGPMVQEARLKGHGREGSLPNAGQKHPSFTSGQSEKSTTLLPQIVNLGPLTEQSIAPKSHSVSNPHTQKGLSERDDLQSIRNLISGNGGAGGYMYRVSHMIQGSRLNQSSSPQKPRQVPAFSDHTTKVSSQQAAFMHMPLRSNPYRPEDIESGFLDSLNRNESKKSFKIKQMAQQPSKKSFNAKVQENINHYSGGGFRKNQGHPPAIEYVDDDWTHHIQDQRVVKNNNALDQQQVSRASALQPPTLNRTQASRGQSPDIGKAGNNEEHLNKLLELINVHNLVGGNLPGMHYTTHKNGTSYNGVFMGDGAVVSQQANATLQDLERMLEASELTPSLSVSITGSIKQKKKLSQKKPGERLSMKHSIEISETALSRYKNNDGSNLSQRRTDKVFDPGMSGKSPQMQPAVNFMAIKNPQVPIIVPYRKPEEPEQEIAIVGQGGKQQHIVFDRQTSSMRNGFSERKRSKVITGPASLLPSQINSLQQQQSDMMIQVLSDGKKRQLLQSKNQLRIVNGLEMQNNINSDNPFMLQVTSTNSKSYNKASQGLQVEGIRNNIVELGRKAAGIGIITKPAKTTPRSLQEQQLQDRFFAHIEQKDDLQTPPRGPRPNKLGFIEPPQETQDHKFPGNDRHTLLKKECSIILAMITNTTTTLDSQPNDQAPLVQQLSMIVDKCHQLIQESDQTEAESRQKRAYLDAHSSIRSSVERQKPSSAAINEAIANNESPIKILKVVVQKKINEITQSNIKLRQSFETQMKIQETRRIYEDLLNDITEAIKRLRKDEQHQQQETQNQQKLFESPAPRGKAMKVSGAVPIQNLSPRVLKSMSASKGQALKNQIAKPMPKIQINYQPYTHLDDHPINLAIQKINYIIKLIFKPAKDTGMAGPQNAGALYQLEVAKLSEIQRMATVFNIQIPKRFDSKPALREYFSSKEFILALKQRINSVLYTAINESNGYTPAELSYIQGMAISQSGEPTSSSYQVAQRFFVGRGNNDAIVRSVLKQRSWWMQYNLPPGSSIASEDEVVSEVSLVWTSWKRQKIIEYLADTKDLKDPESGPRVRFYNKLEQNKQLTNKKGVFVNMRDYYRSIGEDPFEVLPLTFLIKQGDINGAEFKRFEDYFNETIEVGKQVEAQRSEALTARYKELEAIRKEQQKSRAGVPPPTKKPPKVKKRKYNDYYDEADDDEDMEGGAGDDDFDQDEIVREIKRRYKVPKNVWIVKPGENTNRGNGINVSSDISEIKQLVSESSSFGAKHGQTKDKTFIVQKYIDHPLLIHNRKFDFRCYGLMTSINGRLKGYFYEDAYIRTSCKEFDIDRLDNKYIHLTNDAVQKFSQDYGKYENGNKMSLYDFQKYLKHLSSNKATGDPYYANIDIFRDLMPQIRRLVADSYRAVSGKIDPDRLSNTFELLGYDFMLDEDFKLSLIEVNTNPCLEISCPLLARIIPEVLDNTFRIVLDPVFPSPDPGHNRKYSINEIPQEIKFTLVFDEEIDNNLIAALKKCSDRQPAIGTIPEEVIESDEESDLNEGEEEAIAEEEAKKEAEGAEA